MDNVVFFADSITNGLVYLKTIRAFTINIQLSFLKQNIEYIKTAEKFYQEFLNLSNELLKYSSGVINQDIIDNELLITKYTLPTYYLTEKLFIIDFPLEIIEQNLDLQSGEYIPTPEEVEEVFILNNKIITVNKNFVDFLTQIFNLEIEGKIFSYSYPYLIKKMIEEVNIFIVILERINKNVSADPTSVLDYEYKTVNLIKSFAIFLRSFIDPSREDIILKAQSFIIEFNHLITEYRTVGLTPENQKELTAKSKKIIDRFSAFLEYIINQLLESEVYLIVEPLFLDNMYHSLKVAQYFLFKTKEKLES